MRLYTSLGSMLLSALFAPRLPTIGGSSSTPPLGQIRSGLVPYLPPGSPPSAECLSVVVESVPQIKVWLMFEPQRARWIEVDMATQFL
jgi:hypothetical protein